MYCIRLYPHFEAHNPGPLMATQDLADKGYLQMTETDISETFRNVYASKTADQIASPYLPFSHVIPNYNGFSLVH